MKRVLPTSPASGLSPPHKLFLPQQLTFPPLQQLQQLLVTPDTETLDDYFASSPRKQQVTLNTCSLCCRRVNQRYPPQTHKHSAAVREESASRIIAHIIDSVLNIHAFLFSFNRYLQKAFA